MRSAGGAGTLGALALFAALGLPSSQEGGPPRDTLPASFPADVPLGLPAELAETRASGSVVALGRRLFFDPILSVDRTVACASCHDPETGFADDQPLSAGVAGRRTLRNAPTLYNRALGTSFMWDGRASTLESQVLQPIENELEMDLPLADAVQRLAAAPAYVALFAEAFGEEPSEARLADALAGFVRCILRGDSRVDRFRRGSHDALTPAERGGMWLFESRGGCWRCHGGVNFTDEAFHNTGVGAGDGELDEGRDFVTGEEADRGAFKTPTLRGLVETAPYMHDGSLATLEEVVEFYREGGHANENLDPLIAPVEMTDQDVANLVAFLRAL
jgi:cytochrome c peroxidase